MSRRFEAQRRVLLTFWTVQGFKTKKGCTALRMPRVFATGLGDQNMVIEGVDVEVEARRRGMQVLSSEVLVVTVREGARGGSLLAMQGPLPRLRRR